MENNPQPATEQTSTIVNSQISDNTQQPPIPPEPKKVNHKLIYAILGGIILLLLVVIGVLAMQMNTSSQPIQTPPPPDIPTPPATLTPSPTTDPTAGWETYTGGGYAFRYPNDWGTLNLGQNSETLMVAPQESIHQVSQMVQTGGFGGGSFLIMLINETDDATVESDEFQKVNSQPYLLDGKEAIKYELEVIQESPLGAVGDRLVDVRIPHNERFLSIDLVDYKYLTIYNQILSTFEFTDKGQQSTLLELETDCSSDNDCQSLISHNSCELFCANTDSANQLIINSLNKSCDSTLWDLPSEQNCSCINNTCTQINP